MSIKAAAFDYGGVIAFFQGQEAMKDLADLAEIEVSLMNRIYWESRPGYDLGQMDGRNYFKSILAGVGVFPDPDLLEKMFLCDLESWSHVNPETEKLIRDVKSSGLKTAILSNIAPDHLNHYKKTLPVFGLFDAAVFSCETGAIKPDEKIYRILLSQMACEAEELVFFDDREINVAAAAVLGIKAFLWDGAEAARKILEL
ncbi:MAG: HAD family phosphatase [Treponema sp.]|nr:HAD family phosphatase [Treponema sp.]